MNYDDLTDVAHEIWAAAQLIGDDGIVDGVDRIIAILDREFNGGVK